jgi:hypothetical protein
MSELDSASAGMRVLSGRRVHSITPRAFGPMTLLRFLLVGSGKGSISFSELIIPMSRNLATFLTSIGD